MASRLGLCLAAAVLCLVVANVVPALALRYTSNYVLVNKDGVAVSTYAVQVMKVSNGSYCVYHLPGLKAPMHVATLQGLPGKSSAGSIVVKENANKTCNAFAHKIATGVYTYDTHGNPTDKGFSLANMDDALPNVATSWASVNKDTTIRYSTPASNITVQKQGTGYYCVKGNFKPGKAAAFATLLQTDPSTPTYPPYQGLIYVNSYMTDSCTTAGGISVFTLTSGGKAQDAAFTFMATRNGDAPISHPNFLSGVFDLDNKVISGDFAVRPIRDSKNGMRYCIVANNGATLTDAIVTPTYSEFMSLVNPIVSRSSEDCPSGILVYFFLPFWPQPAFFESAFNVIAAAH